MIELARNADPTGDYRLVRDGDFTSFASEKFDLILSAFAFDNIPEIQKRRHLLRSLASLLKSAGRIVMLGSTPDIYTHEWASFSTKDFPENRRAKGGDTVRIVMKDVADARPVVDVVWFHHDYAKLFAAAEMNLVAHYAPLGRADEPIAWISERTIAPWVVYVLANGKMAR